MVCEMPFLRTDAEKHLVAMLHWTHVILDVVELCGVLLPAVGNEPLLVAKFGATSQMLALAWERSVVLCQVWFQQRMFVQA